MWHPVYKRVHVKAMHCAINYFSLMIMKWRCIIFRRVRHLMFQVWELWMKKEVRLAPNLAGQHLVLDIKREVFLFYSTNSYRSLNIWGKILTTKQKLLYTNLYWPPLIGLRKKTVYQMCSVSLIWKSKIKKMLVNLNTRKDVWKYLKNKISHQNAVLNFIKIYVYRNFSFP